MSDFETKTDYLIETKSLLKDRINSLGGSITSGTTFRDYLVWLDSLYEALEEKTITGLPDSLEGKCEQTGTPTPTSPQPINVVSGRQEVSVVGKNLLDISDITTGGFITNNGDGSITLNGTGSSGVSFTLKKPFTLKANTTYTMSLTNTNSSYSAGTFILRNGNTNIFLINYNVSSVSYTPTQDVIIDIIRIFPGGLTFDNFTFSVQLEKGNQATTYEEYKGGNYEINLGKNLLNIDGTRTSEGLINTTSGTIISVSGTSSNTYSSLTQQITQNIPIGTYTFSIQETYSKRIGFIATFSDNTTATYNINANALSTTFTTAKEIKSYRLYMETTNGTTYNMTIKPQLEKGSVATTYAPYKTPIYLGKIGNYKDYIFKNTTENPLYDSNLEEGQWYIHKEIGRVVLNGSESGWAYDTNNQFFVISFTGYLVSGNNIPYCNYYKGRIPVTAGANVQNNEIALSADSTKLRIYVKNTSITSANNFKTWLSTHNTEVYYILNTPTNTLIEDEELINQLNEIEIFTVISEDFYN